MAVQPRSPDHARLPADAAEAPPTIKFRAFISYSHRDTPWATWLLRRLEACRVPKRFRGRMSPIGVLGARIAPVFRDRDELPTTSDLGGTIRSALSQSATLIVICSPGAAQSRWVNQEILEFKRVRGAAGVFAFIVDGEPNAEGTAEDCFPLALRRDVSANGEPTAAAAEYVAADARAHGDGKEDAFIRLVAGLMGVGFDDLRQRRLQRRYVLLKWLAAALLIALIAAATLTWHAVSSARAEVLRASRADIRNGSRLLEEGNATEGIAYLLRAARKDPLNPIIAPRLASVLTSRSFMLPDGAAVGHPAPLLWQSFSEDVKYLGLLWTDGVFGSVELATGKFERSQLPSPPNKRVEPLRTKNYLVVLCADSVARVLDRRGRVAREIRFNSTPESITLGDVAHSPQGDLFAAHLTNKTIVVCDAVSGKMIGPSIAATKPVYVTLSSKWIIWCDAPNTANGTLNTVAHLRDAETGHETTLRSATGAFDWVAGPSGQRLAVVEQHSDDILGLRFLALPDGKPLTSAVRLDNALFRAGVRLAGGCYFSPDGRVLATWYSSLELWDTTTGQRIARVARPGTYVGDMLQFSPDGRTLATWTNLGALDLWDVATGNARVAPLKHIGNVTAVSFSADGRHLLTSASDGLARVWNTTTGQLVAEPVLRQPNAPVAALASDGTHLAIGTVTGDAFRFTLHGRVARSLILPTPQRVLTPPFLPGAPTRLFRMDTARAWFLDVATGREVPGGFTFPEAIRVVGNSFTAVRDDLQVVVVRTQAGAWHAWWLTDGRVKEIVPMKDAPTSLSDDVFGYVSFSGSGDMVVLVAASVAGRRYDTQPGDGEMRAWNLRTGEPMGPPIAVDRSPISSYFPKFSPDGRRLVLGSLPNRSVKIWDVASGNVVVDLGIDSAGTRMGVFSPDGKRLVTANRQPDVHMWEVATGKQLGPTLIHSDDVFEAVFSPDGSKLATHSADGVLHFWDGLTGAPLGEVIENRRGSFRYIRFSADGNRIVTASNDGTARIWDCATSLPLTDPMPHPVRVPLADFSPDERFIRTELNAQVGFHVWSIPPPLPPGMKTPGWLLQLAKICAAKTLNDDGRVETAVDAFAEIDVVRRTVDGLPADAPYAEWGKWFFANPETRSIAPGFVITRAEAERVAKQQ